MTNFAEAVEKALRPSPVGEYLASPRPPRTTRCRYLNRLRNQCTGEAVDPDGEILLCTHHLARAMELLHRTSQLARTNRKEKP